ncbi:MAG: hypothetical protein K0U93_17185, partial [Gammaproteobacteria bacterium]|nr:hypothetical protein [Gammaproteobacteria bacterium]
MTEPQALSRDSQSTIGGRLRNVLVLILTLFCVAIGVAFFGFRNPSIEPQSIQVAARDLVGNQPSKLKLIY